MSWFGRLRLWPRARLKNDQFESEMDEELRFHLQAQIEDAVEAGMSPDEARRTVLSTFGGFDKTKEECRDTLPTRYLDDLWKDLRYGLKMLRRNLGFTVVAVVTLALGVGATTAIFTVVNAVLLRPLPYAEPERLVYVKEHSERIGLQPFAHGFEFIAWSKQSRTLSQIAAYFEIQANLTGAAAERITCGTVTASFFPLLNVQPAIGRVFLPDEDRPGGPPVVILSHALWMRRFGGDRSVLGKELVLDAKSYTVVGVLPAGFRIPDRYSFDYDLWMPLAINEADRLATWMTLLRVIGRLKPDVTLESARSELDTIMQSTPAKRLKNRVVLLYWHNEIIGEVKLSLLVFLAAVGFVLLIACVNVANLLLS